MSTTVSYKGATIATVSNDTKTLLTEGKYLEDDLTLTDVSGGGSTLITKSISANGTYNASSDSADGYSQVNVAVPASAVDTGTKNITANGSNQDVVGYAAVDVAVPNSYSASDEGKVVSNGALVAQTSDTVTANDTYDTTLINSLTVNVSGGGGGETDLAKLCNGTLTRLDDDGITDVKVQLLRNTNFTTSVFLKNCETLTGGYCFGGSAIQTIVLPSLKHLSSSGFFVNGATSLTKLDIGSLFATDSYGLRGNSLNGASALNVLVLRKTSAIVPLQNISAFTNTCFASGNAGGTLYVPNDLIASYQSASNWSTILGYNTNSIKSIESTHTDPNAPIDLTLYYADGTAISS